MIKIRRSRNHLKKRGHRIVNQIRTFDNCGINFPARVSEKHREYFVYFRAFSTPVTLPYKFNSVAKISPNCKSDSDI